jgi:hypothetical protein
MTVEVKADADTRVIRHVVQRWPGMTVSTVSLPPFFSLPSSPLFLGKLMGDPTHPFLSP